MISEGYGDIRTLERRATAMEDWLRAPELMRADANAEYFATIEIDLDEIKEPIVCCPNDPDDAKTLSEVAGNKVDESFYWILYDEYRSLSGCREAARPGGKC